MTEQLVPARTLGDALWAVLDALPNLQTFRGFVGTVTTNPDGTVGNYAVLYETPGQRSGSRVGSKADRLAGTFQITCVGRDTTTCLWTVDRVVAAFTGQRFEVPGRTQRARVTEDPSNRGQLVQVDEDFDPPRFYAPLLFNIHT